jgi:hypothetical protein
MAHINLWDVLVLMDEIEDAGTAVDVENLVFSIRTGSQRVKTRADSSAKREPLLY